LRRTFLRSLAANLGLVVLTVAAFVFFLEVGFRIVSPGAAALLGSQESVSTRPSTLYGWENTPGAHGSLVRDEFTIEVINNSQGLRDREYSLARRPGVPRVAVIGDSFAWGPGVNVEQRFDGLLEQDHFPGTEFINFGVVAYGTDQCYLTMKERVPAYDPDLVVLIFFAGNDVLDNVTRVKNATHKPLFEVRDGELTQVDARLVGRMGGLSLTQRLDLFLRNHLVAYRFFSLRYERSRLRFQLADKEAMSAYLEVYRRDVPESMARGWQVTEALLARMGRLAAEAGMGFGIVVVPAAEQVDASIWEQAQRDFDLQADDYDLELPNRRLVDWGRAHGVPTLDLLPALRRALEEGEDLYYPFDRHLTPAGSAVMAAEMADWLRDLGFPGQFADDVGG